MIDLFSNPLILLLAATLVITSLLFLFVGKKKKTKKVEKLAAKKQAEAKDEKVQKVEEDIKKTEENSKNSENFLEEVKGFDKNEEIEINKNGKRVTKVYIRKPKENNVNNDDLIDKETQKYQDLSCAEHQNPQGYQQAQPQALCWRKPHCGIYYPHLDFRK